MDTKVWVGLGLAHLWSVRFYMRSLLEWTLKDGAKWRPADFWAALICGVAGFGWILTAYQLVGTVIDGPIKGFFRVINRKVKLDSVEATRLVAGESRKAKASRKERELEAARNRIDQLEAELDIA
jgi:hypothetical protein